MPKSKPLRHALILTAALAATAWGDTKYSLHEAVRAGESVTYAINAEMAENSTTTLDGKSTVTDTDAKQKWKVTLNVLDAEQGSATRCTAIFSKDSVDITRKDKEKPVESPCPFAGRPVILMRDSDGDITTNYTGDASVFDQNELDGLVTPDALCYPNHPVAVGDVWDDSSEVIPYSGLGPDDRLASKCRLDWVKNIDGKEMAQISNVEAVIYHEQEANALVEEDMTWTSTLLVDVAAGRIVKADQAGTSTFSTPAGQAMKKTGGTKFEYRCEVVGTSPLATQP